jgi:hypothetical protein
MTSRSLQFPRALSSAPGMQHRSAHNHGTRCAAPQKTAPRYHSISSLSTRQRRPLSAASTMPCTALTKLRPAYRFASCKISGCAAAPHPPSSTIRRRVKAYPCCPRFLSGRAARSAFHPTAGRARRSHHAYSAAITRRIAHPTGPDVACSQCQSHGQSLRFRSSDSDSNIDAGS